MTNLLLVIGLGVVIVTAQECASAEFREMERYEDDCSMLGASALPSEQGKFFSCYQFCKDLGQFPSRFSNNALCECRIPVNCNPTNR